MLAVSCQGSLVEEESGDTARSTLSERDAALLARDAIEETVGKQLNETN